MRLLCTLLLSLCAFACALAHGNEMQQTDTLVASLPKVRASIVVAAPGTALYSSVGHVGLRLECRDRNLDYIFTAEGEELAMDLTEFFRFIFGRTEMGVYAVPTGDYIQNYSEQDRQVRDYELLLSDSLKVALWKNMDGELMKPNKVYDYVNDGCVQSLVNWLTAVIPDDSVDIDRNIYQLADRSRKDIVIENLPERNWVHTTCHILMGGCAYTTNLAPLRKIMTPDQLIYSLQHTKIGGHPLLASNATVLLDLPIQKPKGPVDNALLFIAISVLLAAHICRFYSRKFRIYALLPIITMDILMTVLYFSPLVGTEWNWLLLPFNIIPLLLWPWRRYYAVPLAVVRIVWVPFALFGSHPMADITLAIFTLAAAYVTLNERFLIRFPDHQIDDDIALGEDR